MIRTMFLSLALAGAAFAQGDKQELRYKLEKGEKVTLDIKYSVSVKLDKVPEVLQGAVGEDFLEIKFEGVLAGEVTGKSDKGVSTVEAKWKTLKVKGHALVEDIDFQYDAEKKPDAKPKPGTPDESGMLNLQAQFKEMALQTLQLQVDALGRASVAGGDPKAEVAQQFLALNGLMGPLPEGKVGKGDSWKGETKLEIPLATVKIPIKIRSECTFESVEKVGDRECAVIQSKLRVGAAEGDGDEEVDIDKEAGIRMKLKGEGKARTCFSPSEGRPAKSENDLKVRFSTQFSNPGGGDDIKLEGTLKIDLSHALKH